MQNPSRPGNRPHGQPQDGNNGEPQVPPTPLPQGTYTYSAGLSTNPNPPTLENPPSGLAQAGNTGGAQAQPRYTSGTNRPSPLSGGDEMMSALQEIPITPPGFRTRGNRTDPSATLRQMYAQSQRRESAAPATTPSDAKRPRSESSPTADPKRLKMVITPKRPGPKNFQDIWSFNAPCKSLLRAGNETDFVIGSISNTKLGYGVKCMLDGGKYGEPSVSITIGINITGQNLEKDKFDSFCTLTWEPGVKVKGQWMMQNIQSVWTTMPGITEATKDLAFPAHVRASLPNDYQRENLMAISFQSFTCRSSGWDPNWTDNLPSATANMVKATMAELLRPKENGTPVILTFVPPSGAGAPAIGGHIIRYLQEATERHFPPLVQYMDEECKPMLNNALPTIDTIGDGMYVNYSLTTLPNGQKVKDPTDKKTYRTVDLRYNWNAISSFSIMQGVPVVHDKQYARGLHAPLEKAWHHIFL